MRRAVLIRPGEIRVESADVPDVGEGEILLKVRAALTCGTDVKTYRRGHPLIPLPTPLGHEFAGEVAALGEGVEGFREGMRVVAAPSAPCGACFFCGRGEENLCETLPERLVLGAYADYVRLPAPVVRANAFAIPEDLPFEEAALMEPLACVVHGQRRLGNPEEGTVAIIGAGPIALLHLLLVLRRGADKVIVIDQDGKRLGVARQIGAGRTVDRAEEEAEEVVRDLTDGYGADSVIECAGDPEAWGLAARLARKGGSVLLFGGCPAGSDVTFDTGRVHYGEMALLGSFHYTPRDVRESYHLLISGGVDWTPLISGSIPLEDVESGLRRMMDRECLKLAVLPGEPG